MPISAASLFEVSPLNPGDIERAIRVLGMSPKDRLRKENIARGVKMAFTLQMADRIRRVCADLGIKASERSIINIATTLSVDASAEFPAGHPLSSGDRQIAEELVYQSDSECMPDGNTASRRSEAKRRVAFGERGRTTLHWIGENIFGVGR